MIMRVLRGRPRRFALVAVTAGLVAIGLTSVAVAALVEDSGTYSVIVPNKETSSPLVSIGDASVKYIGSSAQDQSSGTGLFDPFVRLQNDETEKGYNTNGAVEFDTKSGQWTKAILASAIPVVDCDGDAGTPATCWELFVDINENNTAKYVSLTDVEIWFTNSPTLVGYDDDPPGTGFPASATTTKEYDFSGEIQIHDVNQGSGRGDLLLLVPIDGHPFTSSTYFVLFSRWGSTTAAPDGKTFRSDGGFEEWKVRKAPNVSILKTADAASVNAGQNIGFTVTVTNSGAADATGVTINDPLPFGTGVDWSIDSQTPAGSCSISGSPPTEVLGCGPLTLAAGGGQLTVHVTSATTAASCKQYNNTATITAGGSGSSSASTTVNCAAIMILKQSTKTGNPLVNNGTDPTPASTADNAEFGVDGPDAGTVADFSIVDNSADDGDSTYGEVCVAGLAPGTYNITETRAPLGYALSTGQTNDTTAAAVSGTSCATGSQPAVADRAVFQNPPLGEVVVDFNDLGSGETKAKIVCDKGTPSPAADPTPNDFDDNVETYTRIAAGSTANPNVVTCTISIDP